MGLFSRKPKAVRVIDLRAPAGGSAPAWGSPVPCPVCRGRGYLDHIDPFREVMYLHCLECPATYDVTRAELESSRYRSTV